MKFPPPLKTPSNRQCDLSTIIDEVFTRQVYTRGLNLARRSTVVDIGANVGVFSIYAASLGYKVLAFEPATDNFDCLAANLVKTKAWDVRPFKCGVAGGGERTLYKSAHAGGHLLFEASGEGVLTESETIATVTLAEVVEMAGGRVHLLKVDAEGSEGFIFRDPEPLAAIANVSLEYHDNVSPIKSDDLVSMFAEHYREVEKTVLEGPFGHIVARS